jgi:hypothetical protein
MNKVILLLIVIFLNGCCYNQYERKGYSVGFDCVTPSERTVKVCDQDKPNEPCDDKVRKVKELINAQSTN